MKVRVWSRKVVAVLRDFHNHSHRTLFGVTGDIDNLGIYVARNGRAKAEILVDMYNRLIGSIFYKFLGSKPHEFFETCFLPAGEEIFILGTATDKRAARSLFNSLHSANAPELLEKNIPPGTGGTDITFGCDTFESDFRSSASIVPLLSAVENGDMETANSLYVHILGEIRMRLSIELDRRKFASLRVVRGDETLLRNLVYLKTIQYKEETGQLLRSAQEKFSISPDAKSAIGSILGGGYGLKDLDAREALSKVLEILSMK